MSHTSRLGTVFFLSDYGTRDEFVGVVHAVIASTSPDLRVIDLTHHIPAFDVRAGSRALVRAIPYLGPGVVLAVVDPGVGSARRGLCVEVTPPGGGPAYFVGPDNGLLIDAAELAGASPITRAFALHAPPAPPAPHVPPAPHAPPTPPAGGPTGTTFDGRDLFAPVTAALCAGRSPEELGDPIAPDSLIRLAPPTVTYGTADGAPYLRAEATWVDHFGNVQLAVTSADARRAGLPTSGTVTLADHNLPLRLVGTFDDLAPGELGLLVDANGSMAVVAGRAAAAAALGASAGDMMVLTW